MCKTEVTVTITINGRNRFLKIYIFIYFWSDSPPPPPPHTHTLVVAEHVHEIVVDKMTLLSVVIEGVLWTNTHCLMEIVGQRIYSSVV